MNKTERKEQNKTKARKKVIKENDFFVKILYRPFIINCITDSLIDWLIDWFPIFNENKNKNTKDKKTTSGKKNKLN